MEGFAMIRKTLLAAVAAGAMMAGSAHAATIFSQNYSGGLGANETVHGAFGVKDGKVGHTSFYYPNADYSYYQVRLDLTQAISALLMFDFDIHSESTWDGMNLVYGVGGAPVTNANLLTPMSAGQYGNLQGRAKTLLGAHGMSGVAQGRAMFDLNHLVGQVVDIRFQFASDNGVYGEGVHVDNVKVTGDLIPSAVPEPATWAMMIGGFGMAGAAIRSRRRTCSATAA